MQMNRRGFTAIMDAVLFITLIGIAVSVISATDAEESSDTGQSLAQVCDALFDSKVYIDEFGYDEDDRIMKVSDIVALSLMLEDGAASDYIMTALSSAYPVPGSYGMSLDYNGHSETAGTTGDGWTQMTEREYAVEYKGSLTVRIFIYG